MEKIYKVFDYFEHKEVECTMKELTQFKIGDRVSHLNAGQYAGSSGKIFEGLGTVTELEYTGDYTWGGRCVVARVKWDDGREYPLTDNLLIKA